jgi:capsid protein
MPEPVGTFGARDAMTLQIIDLDRLLNPAQQPDTTHLRGGIEIDPLGCPLAYHIRRTYPWD